MELLKVTRAEYVNQYRLELLFNDGVEGVVDLKDKVFTDHRNIFKPLQNIDFFKKFKQNRWTIEWENGVDLAPEFLYDLMMKDKA